MQRPICNKRNVKRSQKATVMNWFKKISSRIIAMSPAQISWANWALDAMWEYWSTEQGAYDNASDQQLAGHRRAAMSLANKIRNL